MFKTRFVSNRLLPALLLSAAACPAAGQVQALRSADDQFIQGLRERGMSDLLSHFVEVDPPQDPIAQLALQVANKEFLAEDLLVRASDANASGQAAEAVELFSQSKLAFEDVLAAQRRLVTSPDFASDERLPLWQTDFAAMLIERYLPRYHQNVAWQYEFGQPSPEQKAAYEAAMVEALIVTHKAYEAFDLFITRAGQDADLRPRLEEMGIWFKMEDYRRINGPYWYGQAAHGVSLLPLDHPFFKDKPLGKLQKGEPDAQRRWLRDRVVNAFEGGLTSDDRTAVTAKLIPGRTLVRSKDIDDIDDGVELYLEPIITGKADSAAGFLATLGKAVGRFNGGEPDTALQILEGIERQPYVRADGSITSRLLAADLMFRLLNEQAAGKLPSEQPALIAKAYERAYVPLLAADQDPRFKNVLFNRWAAGVSDTDDPASLPATVRMGIGEQLTNQGGALAQQTVQLMMADPANAGRYQQQADEAAGVLARAKRFNATLVGQGQADTVLGRGLYNLGMSKYWLAELQKAQNNGQLGWEPYFAVAKDWIAIADRAPGFDGAEDALGYATGLVQRMDSQFNSQDLQQPEVREQYKKAFELFNENWPQNEVCHANRVYAAFHLYEKQGDLAQAVEVYGLLPAGHIDYFQAKRQMVSAMHRAYRKNANELRVHTALKPEADAPALEQDQWQARRDALQDTLDRQRGEVVEEAELTLLDAEGVIEDGRTPAERFSAATALGASMVVLAGMEAEEGNTGPSLELLAGFEDRYAPAGPYAQLAALQQNPDAARANLQGLVQSAQQQRILSLLQAEKIDAMADQAKAMMQATPDVAASVINGVLNQLRADIEVQERVKREAPFEIIEQRADERITFLADAAVSLGRLLEQWAQGQGKNAQQMIPFRMALADSLMLAKRGPEALKIMAPIVKLVPNSFEISMKTGEAHLVVYKQTKNTANYIGAAEQFDKIINYYNVRPEKPELFWQAWLNYFHMLEAAGRPKSEDIPNRARMLNNVDPSFGGPDLKDKFFEIIDRNGGIERVQPGGS